MKLQPRGWLSINTGSKGKLPQLQTDNKTSGSYCQAHVPVKKNATCHFYISVIKQSILNVFFKVLHCIAIFILTRKMWHVN